MNPGATRRWRSASRRCRARASAVSSRTFRWCAERMPMDRLAPSPAPLTVTTVLARFNAELARFREWLAHDHRDDAFWSARATDAPRIQRARYRLRETAHLLHVERATRRGRIHGTQFVTFAAQQAWLTRLQTAYLPAIGGLP